MSVDASAGGKITFTFEAGFNPEMRDDRSGLDGVSWLCTGGVAQWTDSGFRFDLASRDQGTRLRLHQEYASELSDDDYAVYNHNWGYYLESLRLLCVNGSGKPYHPGGEPPAAQLISVARATPKPGRAGDLERELRARVASTHRYRCMGALVRARADHHCSHSRPLPGEIAGQRPFCWGGMNGL